MSCRNGRSEEVGIHHMGSDRASRRTLIALEGEPPRCGVALKVLATWVLSRTALVRLWCNARSARGQQYFGVTLAPIGSAGRP